MWGLRGRIGGGFRKYRISETNSKEFRAGRSVIFPRVRDIALSGPLFSSGSKGQGARRRRARRVTVPSRSDAAFRVILSEIVRKIAAFASVPLPPRA